MSRPGAHPDHERLYRRFPRLAHVTVLAVRIIAGLLGTALLVLLALTFRAEPAPRHGRAIPEPACTGYCAVTVTWDDNSTEGGHLALTRAERESGAVEVWGRKPGLWGRTELSTSPPAPRGPQWGLRVTFLVVGGLLLGLGLSRRFGPALARRLNPVGWRRARRFYDS